MLILEAKVREGVKPVVTIDSRASAEQLFRATVDLVYDVHRQLLKRGNLDAKLYMVSVGTMFRNWAKAED